MSDAARRLRRGFDDDEDFEDEIGGEGNRVVGARAHAVVEYVTRELAEDPDAIDVEVRSGGARSRCSSTPSPDDLGRLIGRRGRVIQAVRQVARAAGVVDGVRASVDVAE